MKILTIFLLAVTLLSVITKETNKSSETSEKIKKTEDKKSDAKNLKSEGKNTNSHKISRDINNHDIGALFPVTHVNINLQSLPHYEVNCLLILTFLH